MTWVWKWVGKITYLVLKMDRGYKSRVEFPTPYPPPLPPISGHTSDFTCENLNGHHLLRFSILLPFARTIWGENYDLTRTVNQPVSWFSIFLIGSRQRIGRRKSELRWSVWLLTLFRALFIQSNFDPQVCNKVGLAHVYHSEHYGSFILLFVVHFR